MIASRHMCPLGCGLLVLLLAAADPSRLLAETPAAVMRIDYYPVGSWERRDDDAHDAALRALDVAIFFPPLCPDEQGRLRQDARFAAIDRDLSVPLANLRKRLKPEAEVWIGLSELTPVLNSEPAQRRLVAELRQLCQRHDFAGIDIDWEEQPLDADRYAEGVRRIYAMAQPAGVKVSISHPSAKEYLPRAVAARDHYDYLMLQVYDRHTLAELQHDVGRYLRAGIPAGKICIGLGLYTLAAEQAGEHDSKTYGEVIARGGSSAESTWTDPQSNQVHRYNSRALLRAKAEYARRKRLAGVFTWHMLMDAPYDSPHSQTRILDEALGKSPPAE